MGYVRFEKDWQYNGCQGLRLENDLLRIELFPELGGKIYHWIHKPEDRDFLWQHPRIKPSVLPSGTDYDDHFAGGWDELFPNCGPGQHAGLSYPDHGEYWTQNFDWNVEQSGNAITLYLSGKGTVTPTRMERWMTLTASSPVVRFKHRLTHLGSNPVDYLWAFHPALAASSTCEILIPAGTGIIAEPGGGRLSADRLDFKWPMVSGRNGHLIDFSKIPTTSGEPGFEMVYLTQLHEGWYGMIDRASRSGFGLAFDQELFNTMWVFQSHGGWRGLHVVIVEPCTGYPYDLAEAARSGHCARLKAGEVIETETTAVVFSGRDAVKHIAIDGTVT